MFSNWDQIETNNNNNLWFSFPIAKQISWCHDECRKFYFTLDLEDHFFFKENGREFEWHMQTFFVIKLGVEEAEGFMKATFEFFVKPKETVDARWGFLLGYCLQLTVWYKCPKNKNKKKKTLNQMTQKPSLFPTAVNIQNPFTIIGQHISLSLCSTGSFINTNSPPQIFIYLFFFQKLGKQRWGHWSVTSKEFLDTLIQPPWHMTTTWGRKFFSL